MDADFSFWWVIIARRFAQWSKPYAICPKCGIVISDKSGFPIDHSFLMKMREFWFSSSEWSKTMGASLGYNTDSVSS